MRFDLDTYREIGDSLLRNRSRSLLTGFGIFWGLFMLLFMIGGGNGLNKLLMKNFEGFASNTAILWTQQTTRPYKGFQQGREWDFDISDIEMIKKMMPEVDIVAPLFGWWGRTAEYGTNSINCNMKGVPADYAKIEEPQLKYGRYINETDCELERKVCVIGKRVYNSLFPEGGDPCGKMIRISSIYYQVIGVDVSSGNISIQGNADQAAIVPMPVLQKIRNTGRRVDLIAMTGKPGVRMSTLEPRLRQIISRKHDLDPADKSAIGIMNAEQIFQLMDNLFNGVNFLIWLVGLGTILAGAIGVSNIMMVTVKERTTEIGIRRAIGATPGQILSQILAESVTLTLAAGSGGIMLAVLLLSGLEKVVAMNPESTPIPFQIGFWTALASMGLLAVMGMLSGLAPALRAMNIKPVDAMRDE